MFVFFSNRLGCFGSILVSVVLTLVLLLVLGVFDGGGTLGRAQVPRADGPRRDQLGPVLLVERRAGSVAAMKSSERVRRAPRDPRGGGSGRPSAASRSGESGIAAWARAAVLDRDRAVALAPDDQRRDGPEQVEAVDGADALAVDVDHRAQRLEERLAAAGALERAQRADDRPQVGRALREPRAPRAGRRARSSAAERPRLRGDAQITVAAPGSAAPRSSGLTSGPSPPLETSASRSTRSGNCQKNCIATPPPSEWPTIVARPTPIADEQVADRRRVGAERVVAARRRRVAVADQVGRDHRVALGEPQRDRRASGARS